MNIEIRDLIDIVLALHGAAVLICNLTDTPNDDALVARFYRGIELFAGIWTPLVKR
jgi:hypothetical protein